MYTLSLVPQCRARVNYERLTEVPYVTAMNEAGDIVFRKISTIPARLAEEQT